MANIFASDEFYNRLRKEYYSDNNSDVIDAMYKIITNRVKQKFPSRSYLWEDMVDRAVDCIMLNDMREFLENDVYAFAPDRELKRNAWLAIRIKNRGLDVLRRKKIIPIKNPNSEEEFRPQSAPVSLFSSVDSENPDGPTLIRNVVDPNAIDPVSAMLKSEHLERCISPLFDLPATKPEKIIVTARHLFVGSLLNCSGTDGFNQTIADDLNGKTFFTGVSNLEPLLKMLHVSLQVLNPLLDRLHQLDKDGIEIGLHIFDLDKDNVTNYVYSTRKQLLSKLNPNMVLFPST